MPDRVLLLAAPVTVNVTVVRQGGTTGEHADVAGVGAIVQPNDAGADRKLGRGAGGYGAAGGRDGKPGLVRGSGVGRRRSGAVNKVRGLVVVVEFRLSVAGLNTSVLLPPQVVLNVSETVTVAGA